MQYSGLFVSLRAGAIAMLGFVLCGATSVQPLMPLEGRANPFGDSATGDLWISDGEQPFGQAPHLEEDGYFVTWHLAWNGTAYDVKVSDPADVEQDRFAMAFTPVAGHEGYYIGQVSRSGDEEVYYFVTWSPRPHEWVGFTDLAVESEPCESLSDEAKGRLGIGEQESDWECLLQTWPQVAGALRFYVETRPGIVGSMWLRE